MVYELLWLIQPDIYWLVSFVIFGVLGASLRLPPLRHLFAPTFGRFSLIVVIASGIVVVPMVIDLLSRPNEVTDVLAPPAAVMFSLFEGVSAFIGGTGATLVMRLMQGQREPKGMGR